MAMLEKESSSFFIQNWSKTQIKFRQHSRINCSNCWRQKLTCFRNTLCCWFFIPENFFPSLSTFPDESYCLWRIQSENPGRNLVAVSRQFNFLTCKLSDVDAWWTCRFEIYYFLHRDYFAIQPTQLRSRQQWWAKSRKHFSFWSAFGDNQHDSYCAWNTSRYRMFTSR